MKAKIIGIYGLLFLGSDSIYVGSSVDLLRRRNDQEALLRKGKHYNENLQRDWNTYGRDRMVFGILEVFYDPTLLPGRELHYIRLFTAMGRAHNLRMVVAAGSRGRKLSDMTRSRMSKAKRGRRHPLFGKKRIGFGARIAPLLTKSYRFTSPEGEIVECRGLRQFCESNGLNTGCMCSVAKGRLPQHRGWRAV